MNSQFLCRAELMDGTIVEGFYFESPNGTPHIFTTTGDTKPLKPDTARKSWGVINGVKIFVGDEFTDIFGRKKVAHLTAVLRSKKNAGG